MLFLKDKRGYVGRGILHLLKLKLFLKDKLYKDELKLFLKDKLDNGTTA